MTTPLIKHNARKIYKDIIRKELFDDRREYQVEDLVKMYEIEEATALELHKLLQESK